MILGLTLHDLADAKYWLEGGSYLVLFAIVFAETGLLAGFFLPGDSLLFTAGIFAAAPPSDSVELNIVIVVIGVVVCAIAGDQTGFMSGRKLGPAIFRKPDARLFKQEHVHKAKEYFDEHGPKTVILARFVPVVRTFTPVLAGVGNMKYKQFVSFNVIGGAIWGTGVPLLGFFAGEAIGEDNVDKYLLPMIGLVIIASVMPAVLEYRKHKRAGATGTGEKIDAIEDLSDWEVPADGHPHSH